MKLKDKTAVVTGAASGIGRAVALSLAKRGCHLALSDVNEIGLAETVRLAQAPGLRISAQQLDVGDAQAIKAYPAAVTAQHPGVDLLVNNAGVALGGTFEQVSETDFEWLFGINFWGVVRMTRAFLPLLKASDEARIVNISSIFGIIAPAGQTAYSASKFAVRGFSNALMHELGLEGSRVGVTVVHPGGVATAIADNSRLPASVPAGLAEARREFAKRSLTMPPEQAGEIIVTGIERDKKRVMVGNDARILSIFERILPVAYWKLLERRWKAAPHGPAGH